MALSQRDPRLQRCEPNAEEVIVSWPASHAQARHGTYPNTAIAREYIHA
jgi:hypothetical protein